MRTSLSWCLSARDFCSRTMKPRRSSKRWSNTCALIGMRSRAASALQSESAQPSPARFYMKGSGWSRGHILRIPPDDSTITTRRGCTGSAAKRSYRPSRGRRHVAAPRFVDSGRNYGATLKPETQEMNSLAPIFSPTHVGLRMPAAIGS